MACTCFVEYKDHQDLVNYTGN